ncbi:coiled-coil domain-containing glutamate-rich protein 2 [Ochotona curzoniae]|uniref:coiled-coil domain-containing glutamate-rich protein 2 n=1 Tax=Ochotona curzoniae TaxID=130825 RepID=UPI001B349423|nr:coiled-coil domain-containing glutamate-rich protein 2 [Ochotona curzoniae]
MPRLGLPSTLLVLLLLATSGYPKPPGDPSAAPVALPTGPSKQELTRCLAEVVTDILTLGQAPRSPCTSLLRESSVFLNEKCHVEPSTCQFSPWSLLPGYFRQAEPRAEQQGRDQEEASDRPQPSEDLEQLHHRISPEAEAADRPQRSENLEQLHHRISPEAEAADRPQHSENLERLYHRISPEAVVRPQRSESLEQLHRQLLREEEELQKQELVEGLQHLWKLHSEDGGDPQKREAEAEEKGVHVAGGGHSLWQGPERAGDPYPHHHHQQQHLPLGTEAAEREEQDTERLVHVSEELRKASEALGRELRRDG